MSEPDVLKGKRILAVDDEPDIIDSIRELLQECDLTTALDYETALRLINEQRFDLVILDIMGVRGFDLLSACSERGLPAAMLTARSLDVESINRAIRLGAVSFLPKDHLAKLPELTVEILECVAQGKTHWEKLFERLGPFFKEKLGLLWSDFEKPPYPPTYY